MQNKNQTNQTNQTNFKEFAEILAELDAMIKADFVRFKKDLAKLAESHGINTIFDNYEVDEVEQTSPNSLDTINENTRPTYHGETKIDSREDNS